MPSQQNGYDCGLYLCAAAQAMCGLMHEGSQQAAGSTAGVSKRPQQVAGSTAVAAAEDAVGGTAAGAASSTGAGTAGGTPGSTAEAGSSLKRKYVEQAGSEDSKGFEGRDQQQAGGIEDGKGFEEREREVLQSITSSSIEQLRQRMLELIEERAAKQQ